MPGKEKREKIYPNISDNDDTATSEILTNRLYKWCELKNLINKEQSGFRSSHSTNEQLFKLTEHIKNGFR